MTLSVVALIAEHSFWISGSDMADQFSHAVKSLNAQKSVIILMAEVATAFNNASYKEDSAWLIQWVIDNKLVCNALLYFLFKMLKCQSETQICWSWGLEF
jgi:hypothetical protein